MDDEQMTAAEASRLASIGHLLADSTIWMEPAPELEQAVLAAIRRDASPVAPPSAPPPTPTPAPPPPPPPPPGAPAPPSAATPIGEAPSARRRAWIRTAGTAVAAAAVAVLVTTAVVRRDGTDGSTAKPALPAGGVQTFSLEGTSLAPDVGGTVGVSIVASGTRLQIRLTGLKDRRGGDFYQVWLSDCAATALIPAGSFHNLDDVVAWAGVAPESYPKVTVTAESAAPGDGTGQESSGQVVADGQIGTCPG